MERIEKFIEILKLSPNKKIPIDDDFGNLTLVYE